MKSFLMKVITNGDCKPQIFDMSPVGIHRMYSHVYQVLILCYTYPPTYVIIIGWNQNGCIWHHGPRLNSDRIPWSEMSGCSGFSLDCYMITILPLTFTIIYFQNMTWWIFVLCMGYFSYIVGMYIECFHTFRNGCASLDVCLFLTVLLRSYESQEECFE